MHADTPATPTETTPANPIRRYQCRHIFTDGHRCGSPSLRGKDLCYYHTRSRREGGTAGRSGHFALARIDDRAAVQIALYDVLSRMAGGDIDLKLGSSLLYGLQIASTNLGRPQPLAEQPRQVEEITSDYDLGDLAPIAEYHEPGSNPVILSEEHRDESNACPERSRRDPDTAQPAPVPDSILPASAVDLSAEDPKIEPAPLPLRDYTSDERYYLRRATEMMGYRPANASRPDTLTDEDIIAAINAERHRYGYGPIEKEPTWDPATLSAPPIPHPDAEPFDVDAYGRLVLGKPVSAGTVAAPLPQPTAHQPDSIAA